MPDRDNGSVNTVGEPDEGKPHVRFDEGRLARTLRCPDQSPTPPLIPSETRGRASSPCDPGVGAHIVFVVVDPRQRITVSRNELTVACRLWGSRPIG